VLASSLFILHPVVTLTLPSLSLIDALKAPFQKYACKMKAIKRDLRAVNGMKESRIRCPESQMVMVWLIER